MTHFIFKSIFCVIALLPLPVLHGIGAVVWRAAFLISRGYAQRTEENLGQSHLAMDKATLSALVRQTAREAGKSIIELPWMWCRPLEQIGRVVRSCKGWEHIEAARAQGRGIIFFTPHLGCFEVAALYAARRFPLTVMYRSPRQAWLDRIMRSGRERGLAKLATADINGVRTLLKALKRGEAIGLLPDQVPSKGEGEWVDFFRRPAYTMTLGARLAEATGAPVVLAFAERLPHGAGYSLYFEPLPLDFSASVPQQINAALERMIAISPAQYLWGYNRYKVPLGATAPVAGKEQ